jgi:hypothetical protein
MGTTTQLDQALRATGELLARRGQTAAVVVVGGTALNLLRVVERVTRDVDVIATATLQPEGSPTGIQPPEPLPKALTDAIGTVARDLGLPRLDLIYLKLYAAADDISPASRHVADLLALRPTADELAAAQAWISQTQDPSPSVAAALARVIAHVLATGR